MVPDDWQMEPLELLYEFKNGLNTDKASYGHGTPFVNVMDVFASDELNASTLKGAVAVTKKQKDEFIVKSGDILFNRTSETIEEIAYSAVYLDSQPAVFGGFVIRGRPKTDLVDKYFSKYLFKSSHFRRKAIKSCQGAVRANIGQKALGKIYVSFPPLPEQRKIAQILSTWDQAITTTERLLENSQQRKKGLMQQLLTGKKRLPGFEGEWEQIRLKELLTEEKTRNRELTITRVLSVTNHSGFVLPEDQFSKRVASDNVSNYRVVSKGQYGYNPSRLNVGSFARLDNYDEGILSPMYVVFSVNEAKLNNDYFLNWMKSNEAKQRIARSTQGSVRDSVGFDALCSFPFRLPPLNEQERIAEILISADKEIENICLKVDLLKQEKKALMQQLLTGKRRVKVDVDAA